MAKYINKEAMLKDLATEIEKNQDKSDLTPIRMIQLFIKYVEKFPTDDISPKEDKTRKYSYKIYRTSKTPVSVNIDLYDEQNRLNFELKFTDRLHGMRAYRAIINYLNYQARMRDDIDIHALIEGFEHRKHDLNLKDLEDEG